MMLRGVVQGGVVVLQPGAALPDGTSVGVVLVVASESNGEKKYRLGEFGATGARGGERTMLVAG